MHPAEPAGLGTGLQRVEAEGEWSLFCPNEAPGLADVWGDEFAALYEQYERQGRARRVIPARQLWFGILEAQARVPLLFLPPSQLFDYICLHMIPV